MKRHSAGNRTDKTDAPQIRSWAEQLSHWFRRPGDRDRQRPASGPTPTPATAKSPLLLSDQELDSLKAAYLQRLYMECNSFHLYGLDPQRRALQEGGQALELNAIYTPLNTALRASANPPLSGHRSSSDPASKGEQGSMSALEAAGQESRAIIRGPLGSGKPDGRVHAEGRPRLYEKLLLLRKWLHCSHPIGKPPPLGFVGRCEQVPDDRYVGWAADQMVCRPRNVVVVEERNVVGL